MGGLGNRLFQIAFIYSYSRTNGISEYGIIDDQVCKHSKIDYNQHVFPFINKIQLKNYSFDEENPELCVSYVEKPKVLRDTAFRGYFQSEKYFRKYRHDIIKLFQFPVCPIKLDEMSVFIHIRRGDNVNHPIHGIDLSTYNIKCIEFFKSIHFEFSLYVISDDIDWCIQNNLFQDIHSKIIYVKNLNELETISLMKNCSLGGICQNSSFSWWGAYLNEFPDKIIIFPSKWITVYEMQKNIQIHFSGSYVVDLETYEINKVL